MVLEISYFEISIYSAGILVLVDLIVSGKSKRDFSCQQIVLNLIRLFTLSDYIYVRAGSLNKIKPSLASSEKSPTMSLFGPL